MSPPLGLRVCSWPGCPETTSGHHCARHSRVSPRNHRGVARQARGHGADFDRRKRELVGRPCGLRLTGCRGVADSADYTVPGDWSSPLQPACSHCQDAQGAAITAAHR